MYYSVLPGIIPFCHTVPFTIVAGWLANLPPIFVNAIPGVRPVELNTVIKVQLQVGCPQEISNLLYCVLSLHAYTEIPDSMSLLFCCNIIYEFAICSG